MKTKILLLGLTILLILSCSHKNVKNSQSPIIQKPAKVYIPPFKYVANKNLQNFEIKIEMKKVKYSYNNELMDLIVRDLSEKFYLKIKNLRKDYKPYSFEDVENVFEEPCWEVPLKKIKRRFEIKYLIQGYIIKFIERQGNSFSVKTPAEVDFIITLKDLSTGKIIWQKEYHEKQETLSSNLLYFYKFLKRKGKWLSALELSESAFTKLVKELP